jgi:hypothetical protein
VLPEALTADVQSILADQTMAVTADTAIYEQDKGGKRHGEMTRKEDRQLKRVGTRYKCFI